MRALTIASVLALTAVADLGQVEAKGCVKGAVAGDLTDQSPMFRTAIHL